MARIIPLQAKITLQQTINERGDFYPACIFSNDTFLSMFEAALIVSKDLIDPEAIERATVDSVLIGLSEYRVWKANRPKTELPTEITEHFSLLPDSDCNIEMLFQPYNNVPTEALLYSHGEVLDIVGAFRMAMEKADAEQLETIQPLYDGFNRFLTDWEANQQATKSYFANPKNV
ncbi:MAG: hypothetical protein LLF80_06130 [Porphyromonadaceae bacterium]|nr:hypothetical protein [Porphyromonadaceae bacterium]